MGDDLGNHRRIFPSTIAVLLGLMVGLGASPLGAEASPDAAKTGSEVVAEPDPRPVLPVPAPREGRTASPPGLDALLQLPTGYIGRTPPDSVAGANETEWRRRFRNSREALVEARAALEKTKKELDGAALDGGSSQWNVAPPIGNGGGGDAGQTNSPVSFKLRQALKRNRVDLEAAEKAMRELEIEANLAGVPASWRGQAESASQPPPEVGQLLD